MYRILFVSIVSACILACTSSAQANPTCLIGNEKKAFIKAILCGQNAPEAAYRFSGPDCVRKSLARRLEDSIVHVEVLLKCGHAMFAERYKKGVLESVKFMQTLSVCTNDRLNVSKVYADREKYVRLRLKNSICNKQMRALIKQRKPYFESLINIGAKNSLTEKIFNKLEISVDQDGNVIEK